MLWFPIRSPVSRLGDPECYAEPRLNRRILWILYISRRRDLVPSGKGGTGCATLVTIPFLTFLHTIPHIRLRLMAFYSV